MSRQRRPSGSPDARRPMAVPHDILVSDTVTRTCLTGFAPDSVTAAGAESAAGGWPPAERPTARRRRERRGRSQAHGLRQGRPAARSFRAGVCSV
jgi:hypothetical protein